MDEFKLGIKDLLDKLEGKTGNKYQLVIQEFGKVKYDNEEDIIVGAFEDRKVKVIVSEEMFKEKLNKYKKESDECFKKIGIVDAFKEEVKMYQKFLLSISMYEKINGIYNSCDEIRDKIQDLQQLEQWDDIKEVEYQGKIIKVGKCKKCGKYNREDTSHGIGYNRVPSGSHSLCQNCSSSTSSIWNGISISETSGDIYYNSGARYSICYTIGKFELL